MRRLSFSLICLASLAGCDKLGAPTSGLSASDQPVTMRAGAYDVQRTENGDTDGLQRRTRSVRHDVVDVPDVQTRKWPQAYLPLILDRLEQRADDCEVYGFQITGNQFKAKGECRSSDSDAELEAQFTGLRGTDSFEIRAVGEETFGSGADEHKVTFDNLYVGKRFTEEEVAKALAGEGSSN